MHMVESGFSNRLICLDSETRIWKFADKFCIGEFIETTPLGGAVYPTLANVNHSCDPNFTIVNYGRRGDIFYYQCFFFVKTQIQIDFLLAVAVATRRIKTGMEVHDSYGAVWYHMDRTERQRFLKVFFSSKNDTNLSFNCHFRSFLMSFVVDVRMQQKISTISEL